MIATSPEPRKTYRIPVWTWVRVTAALAGDKPIDLAETMRHAFPRSRSRFAAMGLEHIPAEGPFIVIGNHYQRPGLWIGCSVGLVSLAIKQRRNQAVHYVIVSEFARLRVGPFDFKNPALGFTRRLFERIARLSGLVTLPLNPDDKMGRAHAMRELAGMLKKGMPVGIFPEGDESMALHEARPGSGGFVALLSDGKVPILPAGIYESQGRLIARFGPTFTLSNKRSRDVDREQFEAQQRTLMMTHIARLLPQEMQGIYRPVTI